MKILKGAILVLGLLAFSNANAQDDKLAQAKNKMKRMDTNKDNSVSLDEMLAFYKDKKDKNGKPRNGEEFFIAFDHNDDKKVTVEELAKKPDWKKMNAFKKAKKK